MSKKLAFSYVIFTTFLMLCRTAQAQSNPVLLSPAGTQVVSQPAGTTLAANNFESTFYVDQYCNVPGTYDQSCLANTITAAGNNSKIILSTHTYNFSAKLTVSNLINVNISGSGDGTIIYSNGTAFECDNCINGGISNVNFSSSVTPMVIPCFFTPSSRQMSCPSLPTSNPNQIITLDPWGTGIGHIPTSSDTILLPTGALSWPQIAENFDSGVFYYQPTGVKIVGLSGKFVHITLTDSVGSIISHNILMGGQGATDTQKSALPSDRGGAIDLWFSHAQPPGVFSNFNNVIEGNVCTYAAAYCVSVNHADGTVVSNNISDYVGESGFHTGNGSTSPTTTISGVTTQGSTTITGISSMTSLTPGMSLSSPYIVSGSTIVTVGTDSLVMSAPALATNALDIVVYQVGAISYFTVRDVIANNFSNHSGFDGFDISASPDHSSHESRWMTITGNTSCYNFGTGFWGDGMHITFSGNTACYNEAVGIGLDTAFSTISGNTVIDSNLQKCVPNTQQCNGPPAQFAVGTNSAAANGGNTISGNHVDTSDEGGNLIGLGMITSNLGGPSNLINGNYTTGGLPDSHTGFITNPFEIINGGSTFSELGEFPGLPTGSFSPIMQGGDFVTYFDVNGAVNTGTYTLAAHSNNSTGLRIDGPANTLELWGGTIKINGTGGFTGKCSVGTTPNFTNGIATGCS